MTTAATRDTSVTGATITVTAAAGPLPGAPLSGPASIVGLGLAFMGSKALLSAVELNLFGVLAESGPRTEGELVDALGLHPRSAADFLDALVALGLLTPVEPGEGPRRYANAPDAAQYLDPRKPTYVGGMLAMANARLYPFWGSLTEALRTGEPQNEAREGGNPFEVVYADPDRLRLFLHGMTGLSLGIAERLAEALPWAEHRHVLDVGGAIGVVPATLVTRHPHLTGAVFDLPPVGPVFDEYIAGRGLADRVAFHGGDFFADPLPTGADVLVLGSILHDWGLAEKRALLASAHRALPEGGRIVVYDAVIDQARRANAYGLLMSLNMLIETRTGFDYDAGAGLGSLAEAGFRNGAVRPMLGGYAALTAVK